MNISLKIMRYISIGIFLVFLVIGIVFIFDPYMFAGLTILGLFISTTVYFLFRFFEFSLIKNCEKEFPNFLRDIAEAKRSGLSLIQAIETTSKSDYGALTKYVKKMAHQLTWNIPLSDVIENFRKRFEESSIINYSMLVLEEMEQFGGKTEDILDSLADNIENIKETYAEKESIMRQHVMTMYAIFFIFLGISVTLIKFLIPLMKTQGEIGGMSLFGSLSGSPCSPCIGNQDPMCLPCNIYFSLCTLFSFGGLEDPTCYYKSLFFIMVAIQGIFSGLIAGQISSDSILAGIKHAIILGVSGIVLFLLMSYLGVV